MPYVPIDWLRDHVEVPASTTAEELAAALVRVGLEEEEIHPPAVTGPLVVGKVLTCDKETHKNGKTVNYCRVDVGEHNDEPGTGKEPSNLLSRGIICGAHNFGVGDYVVVSLPGTTLPGDFQIAARKTYGHWSDGMICSERELGLGEDHDGIIVLNERYDSFPAPGEPVAEFLGLRGELLEINVTPDRGYCFSMRGVAREYSHSTGATFVDPASRVEVPATTADAYGVALTDDAPIHGKAGCDRFVTRVVTGIDPQRQSPAWMQQRLIAAGMRPISLAVDVTNYVMLDLGQPLHAYDLDLMRGDITVRRARAGEQFTTLDDVERTLETEDLLITDDNGTRILGFAGVMGGDATEVNENTTNVLIEAAHFDPVTVARTARRHKLPSEAAKRFERGVDPLLPPVAAQRAVDLLVEYGGGQDAGRVGDVNELTERAPITFRPGQVAGLAGLSTSEADIATVLESIGCRVEQGESWQVWAPSWRPDLTVGADLVEEVARIVGYDEIPSIIPHAPVAMGLTRDQRARRTIMRALAEHGLIEVLCFPFEGEDHLGIEPDDGGANRLRLANPLADDQPYLRSHLLPNLLDAAARNISRGLERIALVEAGMVVRPGELTATVLPAVGARPSEADLAEITAVVPQQPWHVAGVVSGPVSGGGALGPVRSYDWADAIELARITATSVGVRLEVKTASTTPYHPGRCAGLYAAGELIGHAGEVHPEICRELGLAARTCAFELDTDALLAAIPDEEHLVSHVSTYPPAKEDFAFVVADSVSAADVEKVVWQAAKELAEDVRTFDIYRGTGIEPGHYSIAVALRIRAHDRTLSAEDINQVRHRVIKGAQARLGAQLRG